MVAFADRRGGNILIVNSQHLQTLSTINPMEIASLLSTIIQVRSSYSRAAFKAQAGIHYRDDLSPQVGDPLDIVGHSGDCC